ncbi:MAG: ABC transporter permease [Desulfobacterales bacterium]|nr:ABC transporter permease [Desulfobacterales bacterium]
MKVGLMIFPTKRALQDMRNNKLLHIITIVTIALSILIVSAFILFFINASDVMSSWKKGVRIMAYLKNNTHEKEFPELKNKIIDMYGVQDVTIVTKEEAMESLKNQMSRQASIFENLRENPLPDAFEVRMIASTQNWEKIEDLAKNIESLSAVSDVEYGQRWLGRFTSIFTLFRLAGYAMCVVFFMASVFIVANTIRLLFYSRHDEIEIMRLVGATDNFIKAPFYIEGMLQGAFGGVAGIFILFLIFAVIAANIEQSSIAYMFDIRFLPMEVITGVIFCSIIAGWLGCFLSLKQYVKN